MPDPLHLPNAFLLEFRVAYRQDLVNDENVRLKVRRDRKCQTHIHAARVSLHRHVDELRHARELDYFIEFSADLRTAHAENGTVQENVLAPGKFGMETRTYFKQAGQPAANVDLPARRCGDPAEHFQQRTF